MCCSVFLYVAVAITPPAATTPRASIPECVLLKLHPRIFALPRLSFDRPFLSAATALYYMLSGLFILSVAHCGLSKTQARGGACWYLFIGGRLYSHGAPLFSERLGARRHTGLCSTRRRALDETLAKNSYIVPLPCTWTIGEPRRVLIKP